MDESMENRWKTLSEEVLSGMKEWRVAHPKATFREIEDAVHERVSRLEAQMLQDVALQSVNGDWTQAPRAERPVCPICGTALVARGKQKRRLQGSRGQDISLSRSYGTCPACKTGLFPPG